MLQEELRLYYHTIKKNDIVTREIKVGINKMNIKGSIITKIINHISTASKERSEAKRKILMSNITSSALPPSSFVWVGFVLWIVLEYSKSNSRHIYKLFKKLDDKIYGFCKVLSEGHFRSFYAILENDDFYNMKIKTYNTLKSYILYVTIVRQNDTVSETKLLDYL